MRRRIKKIFKVVKKGVDLLKNNKKSKPKSKPKPKTKAIALLEKELEPFPESEGKFFFHRRKIVQLWLMKYSTEGKLLAKEREKPHICYGNEKLCTLDGKIKGKRTECKVYENFFDFNLCFLKEKSTIVK